MSSFTTPLVVSPMPDGRRWKLQHRFTYKSIVIPAGFVTDFASVPSIFWWLIPSWGKYGKAAVVHDYLYQTGGYTRKEADDIFLEGMKILGVAIWRRHIMYWAVRLFGGFAWKGKAGGRSEGL